MWNIFIYYTLKCFLSNVILTDQNNCWGCVKFFRWWTLTNRTKVNSIEMVEKLGESVGGIFSKIWTKKMDLQVQHVSVTEVVQNLTTLLTHNYYYYSSTLFY